jgi:nucleoside-diphosphate-sugar epimerase
MTNRGRLDCKTDDTDPTAPADETDIIMIFILGANGFVGATVLNELLKFDECVGIDIDNYEEHIGKKCDVLVNVNGNSKKFLAAEQPALEFDLSVRSVVRSIYDFPAKKYVYISTVDVYTDFSNKAATVENVKIDNNKQSPYGFHKWLSEQYVKKTCDKWLITRLGGMVGMGMKKGPIFDLLNGQKLWVHPDSRYQYIPTKTVGEVIRCLLEKNIENEIFNVCGKGAISLREVAEILGKRPEFNEEAEQQHYEINNEKLREIFNIPETKNSVKEYLAAE